MNKKIDLYCNFFLLAFLSFNSHSQINDDEAKVPE